MNSMKKLLIICLLALSTPLLSMQNPNPPIRFQALATTGGVVQIICGSVCFVFTKYGTLLFKSGEALLPFSEGATVGIKTFTLISGVILLGRGVWDILQPSRWLARALLAPHPEPQV